MICIQTNLKIIKKTYINIIIILAQHEDFKRAISSEIQKSTSYLLTIVGKI